ncbi:MAG: SPOR domain-containing protein, partial [Bacteroidales bacterium]|nr:SPOR domain-containing protein [Bacteroidales bacterium]
IKELVSKKKKETNTTEKPNKTNEQQTSRNITSPTATDTTNNTLSVDTLVEENTTPIVRTNTTAPTTTSGKRYYIVAGSFREEANARNFVETLKSKNYPNALMLPNPRGGFYTVAYDSFSNKAEADRELVRINNTERSGSWIISE